MIFSRSFRSRALASVFLAVQAVAAGAAAAPAGAGEAPRTPQFFNPAISAIVDLYYHYDDAEEGIAHLAGELSGFGHGHGHEGRDHAGVESGLNLRHLELQFSADVDPYFKGLAIAAVDLHGAEMEAAEITTTAMPAGFKLRGGKFYSDFGYLNARHAHQWDFTDQPLIHQWTLGVHGLNDRGVQLSWLAPAPLYLLAGAEAFQGSQENLFAHVGHGPLPAHKGPRVAIGWLKAGPDLPGGHGLLGGVAVGTGKHQEEHDGDGDGEHDHWLDGVGELLSADLVYKYNSPRPYGQNDFTVQVEYFRRRKDLKLVAHDGAPELVGGRRVDTQDGYYAQVVHGFLPRWRAGLRWEQAGLTNEVRYPSDDLESFGSSRRLSAMVDFTPSEFSRLRLQANRGMYQTDEGREEITEIRIQWMISLGAHGAHRF